MSIACTRYHNSIEKIYHWANLKTQMCERNLRNICYLTKSNCGFGHSKDDLRLPIFDAKWRYTAFKSEFIQLNYKTEKCILNHTKATPACPYFHDQTDRRRDPKWHNQFYSSKCSNINWDEENLNSSNCVNGDKCKYSHSRYESFFHPMVSFFFFFLFLLISNFT